MADTSTASTSADPAKETQEELNSRNVALEKNEATAAEVPPLTASEFRAYNGMAEHMEYFVSALSTLLHSLLS